jgi:SAM-dependent methyltransferase
MNNVPFLGVEPNWFSHKHRLKVIQEFMGDVQGRALDIGSPNRLAKALGITQHTLETDFNREIRSDSKDYDVITCFDVIEHLINPLGMLDFIYDNLKSGGVCYLTTPRPSVPRNPTHFFETTRPRWELAFRYAGFEIVRYKLFRMHDWQTALTGLRPMWYILTYREHLWELRKP